MSKDRSYIRRRNAVIGGVVLIMAAIAMIFNAVDQFSLSTYGLNWVKLVFGAIMIGAIVWLLIEKKPAAVFIPLAVLFLLFEKTISLAIGKEGENLIPTWIVIVAALFLWVGTDMIIPKHYRTVGKVVHGDTLTIYFDAAKDLANARVHDIAGSATIYITNAEAYPGEGQIQIDDVAGSITVYIPGSWRVLSQCKGIAGKVDIPEQPDGVFEKSIRLNISDIAGKVTVSFV